MVIMYSSTFHSSNSSLQTEKIPGYTYDIVALYLTIVAVCSIVFNTVTAYILFVKLKLNLAQTRILFSMAIMEAIAPACAYPINIYCSWNHGCKLSGFFCSWTGFITFTGGMGSIFHLVLLSAERYASICYPFTFFAVFEPRYLNICLILVWILSAVLSSMPFYGMSTYVVEGIGVSCSVDMFPKSDIQRSYNIVILVAGYVLPMTLIVLFNARFLSELYRITGCLHCKKHGPNRSHVSLTLNADGVREKYLTLLVFGMVFCFNLAWLPYAVVFLIGLTGGSFSSPLSQSLPAFFAKTYTIFDPIVYIFLNKTFRDTLFTMIRSKQENRGPHGIISRNENEQQQMETKV